MGEGDGSAGAVWVVDDVPHERFPIYTRGNVGEVFPAVVSPLTWSALGGEAERGWRDAFATFGALRHRDYGGEAKALVGVFGGYCYLNVSVHRVMAVRTPGLTPEAMDTAIFGESEAPPYEAAPADRSALASLRVARTIAGTLFAKQLPGLEADKRAVAAWLARQPAPATATEPQLLRTVAEFRSMFRGLFASHILTTFRATVATGLLNEICAERLGDPGLVVRLLGGIGDVESAQPASALWALGRMVAADPALTAHFDAGVDGLLPRLEADPAASGFVARFAAFGDEFGSRGPNEWESSSPTWGTDPELALAAVERLRHTDPSHDPALQGQALAADREAATASARSRLRRRDRRTFDLALRASALLSQGRERSKTTVIGAVHGMRLAMRELASRARDRGGPDALEDFWLLTLDELDAYLADPKSFSAVLADRAKQRDRLAGIVPPFVFVGIQPDPSTWARRDGTDTATVTAGLELKGIAGCPGLARGRARVVLDPADPRGLGPGDILVAPITDPSWTPLFVPAEAVVVDVGAQMSHAVIVSRELGIPAVVSVTDATRSIPDGALIEVDGTNGTVRILEV